ncbi:DUF933 domain-containing protein [Bacteroidota bacterium]
MQIGLVGLQLSGKSTLLNTLAQLEENLTGYGKEESRIEVVHIHDERLDFLAEKYNAKKKTYTTLEVFDIPGLGLSEDGKMRMTSNFLNSVKNNDALLYVIRNFQDESIPHPFISLDTVRDIRFLETEFLLIDLGFFEHRIERLKKDLIKSKTEELQKELQISERCYSHLESEKPLRTLELNEHELKILSGYQLLTIKPILIGINCDETLVQDVQEIEASIKNEFNYLTSEVIPFFGKIEYEISNLDEEDKVQFMGEYGIKELALSKILNSLCKILGLQTFFTVSEKECRAWNIKKNSTVHKAAGIVHTDFHDRFIKAEIVNYNDFAKYGSFAKCREEGVWKLEGKEYLVQEGDIILIRHN